MANPFDQFDSTPTQRGPVYGAPPKAPEPPTPLQLRDQDLQEGNARLAAEKAERERREWEATHLPDGTPKPKPEDGGGAAKTGAIDSVVQQINHVQKLYNSGLKDETISNLFGAGDLFNTPGNAAFDSAGAALGDQGMAAFKVPGMGPQSDADAARFVAANQPQASDWDARIEEKLGSLRRRVDANRAALGLPPVQWDGIGETGDDREAAAAAVTGTPPAGMVNPPAGSDAPPGLAPATGGERLVPDNDLAAKVDGMLRAGARFSEVNAFLASIGRGPVNGQQWAEAQSFLRKNPNYKGSLATAMKSEPMDGYDRFVTGVVGSDPTGLAGYAIGAGQFLTGNTVDNVIGALGGDAERARQSMGVIEQESPTGTALGEISGGIMAGLSGEAGLARLGMAGGVARGGLADLAMGGANGAGMADNGNRLEGAARGAVTAGVGSALGAGAMGVAGKAFSPTGGSLSDLYAAGSRPSIGQRAAAAQGPISQPIGKIVNATEEALQSVPGVGTLIRGTRQNARDGFQLGAFNQALGEIGEELPKGMKPGTDPHKFTQEAFNRVYEKARSGMRMVADEELSNDLGQLAPDIATLGPQAQNKLKAIMANAVNSKLAGGEMGGAAYKAAISDLGKHIARHRKGLMAEDQALADVLEGVQGSLDAAARRHSDPAAVELLDAADAGYAKLVRIEEAASKRGGDDGTFSGTQLSSAVQKSSGGVRSKAYLRGDANMQDYARQGKALDDTLPNSGTADRVMAGYAVGTPVTAGAVWADPTVATVLGTIAAINLPGVRKVVTGAMAPGGPRSKAIAAQLKKRARLVGAAGAATSVAALPGTAPAQ